MREIDRMVKFTIRSLVGYLESEMLVEWPKP